MIRFRTGLAALLLALGLPALALAQTTLSSTTLSAAIDNRTQLIPLTSVTGLSTGSRNVGGDLLVVGSEPMLVNAIDTTAKIATVRRGVGSVAVSHASGAVVWFGPRQRFYQNVVAGTCTAANEAFLPHITLPGGDRTWASVYDCIGGVWTRLRSDGLASAAGLVDTTSTASGTTQNTEYTLNSVTIPATDWGVARGVSCRTWGTGAGNANAKNYKFYFGATAVVTLTGTTDNAKDYQAEIVVLRTGASTQAGYGSITSDAGAPDAGPTVTTALAEAETSSITIAFKAANTAAAAASATGKGLYCHWLP